MKTTVIIISIFLLAISAFAAKSSNSKKDKILDGQLTTSSSLPLQLTCGKSFGYILVGGITLNSTTVSDAEQALAVKECDEQMTDPKMKAAYPSMTTCFIRLGRNASLENSGVARGIYRCAKSKPAMAGSSIWVIEDKEKIYDAKRKGTIMEFTCTGEKQIIEVTQVSKAGENVSAKELTVYKEEVLSECYKQTVEKRRQGKKENVFCSIEYSSAKTDDLAMKFKCVEASQSTTSETTYVTV